MSTGSNSEEKFTRRWVLLRAAFETLELPDVIEDRFPIFFEPL